MANERLANLAATLIIFVSLMAVHYVLAFLLIYPGQELFGGLWYFWGEFAAGVGSPLSGDVYAVYPSLVVFSTTLIVVLISVTPFGRRSQSMRQLLVAQLWYFAIFGLVGFYLGEFLWLTPFFPLIVFYGGCC